MDVIACRIGIVAAAVGWVCGSTFTANIITDVRQTAVVNATVVLPCIAVAPGPVRWCFHATSESECDEVAFNGRIVNGHAAFYELHADNLTVKLATADVEGVYMCTEENGRGDWHRIQLTVKDIDVPATYAPNVGVAEEGHARACNCTSEAQINSSSANALVVVLLATMSLIAVVTCCVMASLHCLLRANINTRQGSREESESLIGKQQHATQWAHVQKLLDVYSPKDSSSAKLWTGDKFMFAVVRQPALYKACLDQLENHLKTLDIDAVVGIDANDSRADLFAAPIAERLKKPYVPIVAAEQRAAGATDNVVQKTYKSRFNKDTTIELETLPGINKVVLIDSYLVTGNSTTAAVELIETGLRATVVECIVVVAPKKEVKRNFTAKVWSMLKNDNLDKALIGNEGD